LLEHDRPIAIEMLIQRDVGRSTLEQLGKLFLTALDWQSAQILTIQFEQIESAEYRAFGWTEDY
jgi:hypothetical protein